MADTRPHIFVIEDDPSLRKLLQAALDKSGFRVTLAQHGLEGLIEIDKTEPKPNLLIVDIMMPELDGLSLVRALKSQGSTRRIPVIFVTAKTDSKTIAEGISLGAKYYITKPFTIDDLLGKVKKALGLTA
jgi:DNA-binding response OmpR family regulator